ncbi:RHS repeat-associated core domain-containing protein [Micromonospora halophytica]|uniref:RHS repeat-associated core domain-containing protein n=2 Tax=Micromonospora halophytica TaxID=47864 RepID=A0A1C5J974_9ACTN|nr:RHS repeat-associated core domain-containing protein [Micromonospora halophytica]
MKLAEWSYDGLAKGQLHWAARYVNKQAYGITYSNLDALYRPGKISYTIPSDAGAELAKTYDFTQVYNLDETVQSVGAPAAGGLPAEAVVTSYDHLLRPTGLTGASSYVTGTSYSRTGELMRMELSIGNGKKVVHNWVYERGTGRLLNSRMDRPHALSVDVDSSFNYDEAGNIRSIADTPSGGARDIQCFSYDYLRRLTEAWSTDNSNTDPCAGGPGVTGVGGPAPYHHSWSIDKVGNRESETIHGLQGAADTVRTYRYPTAGGTQPHTLTSVEETGPSGTRTYRYGYGEIGNTECRPAGSAANDCTTGAGSQTLTWNPEGKLAEVTVSGKTTSFVYDGDGNRLVRKEPGATTVYLPGMELRLDLATRQVSGTRFYSFDGKVVAVRGVAGVSFPASDHHGTAHSSVDAGSGAITWRRSTPYGGLRGDQPAAWPDQRGFVGGTLDPTSGLTHLGAREYDPVLGRFISVDPVMDRADPQQWNGYAYANNSPVTSSDPSGLIELDCLDHDCAAVDNGTCSGSCQLPGTGTSSGGNGPQSNYSSDDEERAATGDPNAAAEIRKKRLKQILEENRFDFEHLFAPHRGNLSSECGRGGGAGLCKLGARWAEDKALRALVEHALGRIDESRRQKNKEFGFDDKEFVIAFHLAWEGHNVESRGDGVSPLGDLPAVGGGDSKGFDAYVDGVRSEFKTVSRNTPSAIKNALRKAHNQHADRVYIEVRGVDADTFNGSEGGLAEYYKHNTNPTRLTHMAVFGTDTDDDRWEVPLKPFTEHGTDVDCAGWDLINC